MNPHTRPLTPGEKRPARRLRRGPGGAGLRRSRRTQVCPGVEPASALQGRWSRQDLPRAEEGPALPRVPRP